MAGTEIKEIEDVIIVDQDLQVTLQPCIQLEQILNHWFLKVCNLVGN